MTEFLSPLVWFPLALTVGAYQVGLMCQKKWKTPLANPLLIAVLLVIGVLLLTGVTSSVYQEGMVYISWLLTPATVCLALPLYEQGKLLKDKLGAIVAGVAAGTFACLAVIVGFCLVFRLDRAMGVSLLPKSITTAMAIVLSGQNGGIPALTAIAVFLTGVVGSLSGAAMCKLFRLEDPVAQGVAFGTAAHVIGTSKATELGSLQGAVSSLSLTVAGLLTAVVFPLVCSFLV